MIIKMNSGNFSLYIQGELSESATAKLLQSGLKYEVDRGALSATYKQLGGEPSEKTGKLVLPKGFERESIEFNDDNQAAFEEALKSALVKFGTFSVTVGRYLKGETSESRKRATAMYQKSLAKGAESLEKLASLADYDGDIYDESEFVEAIHAYVMDSEA